MILFSFGEKPGGGKKMHSVFDALFPRPGFFHRNKIESYEINGENMVSIRRSKQVKGELHEKKCK